MYMLIGETLGQVVAAKDVNRAVRLNRRYAQALGWQAHRDRIVRLLGITTYTPDERTFTRAVARWQQRQELPSNGIIEPVIWLRMRQAIAPQPLPRVYRSMLSGLGQSTKIKDFEKRFTYPFWKLPEGKNAQENADGSVTFIVNEVTIHMFPDRLLTEEEFKKEGDTFKYDSRWADARTRFRLRKTNFNQNSVQFWKVDNVWLVTDYKEPTFEISIQVFYRKTKRISTLAKARRLRSAYGKGKTLQGHESWHVADAIDYMRKYRPSLPDMRGLLADDLKRELLSYFDAVRKIATKIEKYSGEKTDCTGKRKASFCK